MKDKPKVRKRNEFRCRRVGRNDGLEAFAAIVKAASAVVLFTVVTS